MTIIIEGISSQKTQSTWGKKSKKSRGGGITPSLGQVKQSQWKISTLTTRSKEDDRGNLHVWGIKSPTKVKKKESSASIRSGQGGACRLERKNAHFLLVKKLQGKVESNGRGSLVNYRETFRIKNPVLSLAISLKMSSGFESSCTGSRRNQNADRPRVKKEKAEDRRSQNIINTTTKRRTKT